MERRSLRIEMAVKSGPNSDPTYAYRKKSKFAKHRCYLSTKVRLFQRLIFHISQTFDDLQPAKLVIPSSPSSDLIKTNGVSLIGRSNLPPPPPPIFLCLCELRCLRWTIRRTVIIWTQNMYPWYRGENPAWKSMNGFNLALCVQKPPIRMSDPTVRTFHTRPRVRSIMHTEPGQNGAAQSECVHNQCLKTDRNGQSRWFRTK